MGKVFSIPDVLLLEIMKYDTPINFLCIRECSKYMKNRMNILIPYVYWNKNILSMWDNQLCNKIRKLYWYGNAEIPDLALTHIKFGEQFNKYVNIPKTLKVLHCGYSYNSTIVLPKLKVLKFGELYNRQIVLPDTLQILIFGYKYNRPLFLPEGLKILRCGKLFNKPLYIPETLKVLILGDNFNQQIDLQNVEIVIIGDSFNQPLTIPKTLKVLIIGNNFNQPIQLQNLEILIIGKNFTQTLDLPETLNVLIILNYKYSNINILPDKLNLFGYDNITKYKYIADIIQLLKRSFLASLSINNTSGPINRFDEYCHKYCSKYNKYY